MLFGGCFCWMLTPRLEPVLSSAYIFDFHVQTIAAEVWSEPCTCMRVSGPVHFSFLAPLRCTFFCPPALRRTCAGVPFTNIPVPSSVSPFCAVPSAFPPARFAPYLPVSPRLVPYLLLSPRFASRSRVPQLQARHQRAAVERFPDALPYLGQVGLRPHLQHGRADRQLHQPRHGRLHRREKCGGQ